MGLWGVDCWATGQWGVGQCQSFRDILLVTIIRLCKGSTVSRVGVGSHRMPWIMLSQWGSRRQPPAYCHPASSCQRCLVSGHCNTECTRRERLQQQKRRGKGRRPIELHDKSIVFLFRTNNGRRTINRSTSKMFGPSSFLGKKHSPKHKVIKEGGSDGIR